MSIGQGAVLVTPMQVARFMSAVANGGVLWKPRLVQRIERPEKGVVWSDAGSVNGHVELSPMVWALLRQSLWSVVNDGGTGVAARIPGLDIAGKTGTAQTIANSKSEKGQDHAWFTAVRAGEEPRGRGGRHRGARRPRGDDGGAHRAADPECDLLRKGGPRRNRWVIALSDDGR